MRKRNCPHDNSQDGVCGCPEFWEFGVACRTENRPNINLASIRDISSTFVASSMFDISRLRSPSPKPLGLPKATCFFWYHGQCRRGTECHLEHAAHIIWPIIPPPGYTHFAPCQLPLCPLREDIVVREGIGQKQKGRQLGGQLDGAVMNSASGSESGYDSSVCDTDSDTCNSETGGHHEAHAVSLAANASSESGANVSKSGNVVEVTVKDLLALGSANLKNLVTPLSTHHTSPLGMATSHLRSLLRTSYDAAVEPSFRSMELLKLTNSDTPSTSLDGDDYIDLSGIASPPPSSEVGDEPIGSLSHPGTERKRRQQDSGSSAKQTGNHNSMDWKHVPDFNHMLPSLETSRKNHQDPGTSMSKDAESPPEREISHPEQSPNVSLKPASFNPPKGPRGNENSPICFYWYHKGRCKYQHKKCPYKHSFEPPFQPVGPSTKTATRKPYGFCTLPLCPLRIVPEGEHMGSDDQMEVDSRTVEVEYRLVNPKRKPRKHASRSRAPSKYSPSLFGQDPSSSTRDDMAGVRSYAKVQESKTGMLIEHSEQLPKFTGLTQDYPMAENTHTSQFKTKEEKKKARREAKREQRRANRSRRRQKQMAKKLEQGSTAAAASKAEHNGVPTDPMDISESTYMQILSDANRLIPGWSGTPPLKETGLEKPEGQQGFEKAVETVRPLGNSFAFHPVLAIRPGRKD